MSQEEKKEENPLGIPKLKKGAIIEIHKEALRATRELDPEAREPNAAIFSGIVAALYRPIIINQIQGGIPRPGQVRVPVRDLLGGVGKFGGKVQ